MPNSKAGDQVAVFITRDSDSGLEILVQEAGGGNVDVIRGPLEPNEHPTEGACRVAAAASGYDVYFTFRKLAESGEVSTCYYYQTSPEIDLPAAWERPDPGAGGPPRRFYWLSETAAPARLGGDLAPAMSRLLQ